MSLLCSMLLTICVMPGTSVAQDKKPTTMYTCRDSSGRMLTSDRPIPECSNQPLRELNANGITTREIPAPLTAEQLRRKAASDEAARIDAIRLRQSQARDRGLLLAYASVDSLETARSRQVADLRHEIELAQNRMIAGHGDLKAASAALAALTARPAQEAAKRNIRTIAQGILADDAAITRLRGEVKEVNDRFDDDGQRLRQLLREPDPILQASRPITQPR